MNLRLYAGRSATIAIVLSLIMVISGPALAAPRQTAMVDKIADYLSIFVIVVVPIVGIGLFLMVHVLPEKIAERRHHPQKDAITTLCLSRLLWRQLWPLKLLWAFTKPVVIRWPMARIRATNAITSLGTALSALSAKGKMQERLPIGYCANSIF